MNSRNMAYKIKTLTIHPAATEEYSAGYQAARHDAFQVAQEFDEFLSAKIADLLSKAPPDFSDREKHVEWGGEVFVWLEEMEGL